MEKILCLALLLICSISGFSQPQDSISKRLESPYEALQTFTINTEGKTKNLDAASIIFNNPNLNSEEKERYVMKYEQLLEGSGAPIFFEEVSTNPDYLDSLTNENRYVINTRFPKIYLQKRNGRWQFQPDVMNQIDIAHKKIFRFGTNILVSDETKKNELGGKLLGLKVWQWLGMIILIICCLLIRYLFSFIFGRLLTRFLTKIGRSHIGPKYILPVAKPMGMIVVFIFIAALYPSLQLPPLFGYYVVLILKGLIPLYSMIILYRLVNIMEVFITKIVEKSSDTLNDQLVPLFKKVLKVLIVLIGGLVIMDSLDIPILPLLTGLSIGGLAFALAAQDTIKNFFGSLMIFIDKPFKIGDWITSGDIDGTVEEVGFRSTRIRTFRNSVVYVPNGKLADSVIDNNGLRRVKRFRMMIAIKYDTPPDRIEVFVEGLEKVLHRHPKTDKNKYEIHLNEMSASSLDVLFYIFFEAPTWSDELKFRQEIILDILRLGERLSVHFAFPTQTVNVENLPGQQSLSPEYTLTKKDLDNRLNEYFDERVAGLNKK